MTRRLPDLARQWHVPLTWGLAWSAMALLLGAAFRAIDPADVGPGEGALDLLPGILLAGLACGATFVALVAVVERRGLAVVPLLRAAAWGSAIGAALPLVLGKGLPEAIVTAPLGALSALVSVAIVRKLERTADLVAR